MTHPSGAAAVSIDGEVRGQDAADAVTARRRARIFGGGAIATRLITQPVEVPAKLELTLKRPTATLHVDSEPAGGEVVVEGKPRGKTPVDATLEAFHHYDVSGDAARHQTVAQTRKFKATTSQCNCYAFRRS